MSTVSSSNASKSNGHRPDPIQRIDTAFFWEACERGELVAQKCPSCEVLWHPPRPMCPTCHTTDKEVQKLSGKGTVMSWVRQERPAAFFFPESPIAVLVELEEGIRLVSNVVGVEAEDMTFGLKVQVDFEKTQGGKSVPVFRPAEDSE